METGAAKLRPLGLVERDVWGAYKSRQPESLNSSDLVAIGLG